MLHNTSSGGGSSRRVCNSKAKVDAKALSQTASTMGRPHRHTISRTRARPESRLLFSVGLLVLFNFYEISLLLGLTIRDLISEPLIVIS